MVKTTGKLRTADGVVFCFLASVIIAVVALNAGLLIEPGKILPQAISMRSEEMSENIIHGIELALEDIRLIRSGAGFTDTWRLLTFIHLDPFFYLACILPEIASRTVLLIGFYIRFGLCCSAMYFFLSQHIKFRRLPSALLAVMYTFSTQIIFTAQFASIMNMAIMIPVLMSAFDSYLQKRTWRSYSAICFCAFGLSATGGFGVITGMPAMVFISLLMCISLYKTFKMAFTSWVRLLAGLFIGLVMDMAFLIPGLSPLNITVDVETSFDNARVTYKVFDLIRGMFLLRSGNISVVGLPVFYIGLFTVAGLVAFMLNEQIPVRLKVASAVILTVIHATCASSFVNETISVFGVAPTINASRLICLEAVLFFIAAIGIRNIKSLKKGEFSAIALIPMLFLLISGVTATGTSLASTIVVATFFGIICEASLVYAIAADRLSKIGKYAVLFAVFALVGVNTMFVMFNNTMPGSAVNEYFKSNREESYGTDLIFDNGFELPAIADGSQYLMIPVDLSVQPPSDKSAEKINYLSELVSGDNLFEEVFFGLDDIFGFENAGGNEYRFAEGKNYITMSPFIIDENSRYFAYCSAPNGASVKVTSEFGDSERTFTGPFITEIFTGTSGFTLKLTVQAESEGKCCISIYRLNEDSLDAINSYAGSADASVYEVDVSRMDRFNTLILPYAYDGDTKINVSCDVFDTINYCGKTAMIIDTDNMDYIRVSAEHKDSGIVPGILISVFAALCLVAIPFVQRYNDKKKETGEGNDTNA